MYSSAVNVITHEVPLAIPEILEHDAHFSFKFKFDEEDYI
jgi:hypothetical protein